LKTSLKIVIFIVLQLICFQQYGFAQDTVAISKPGKQKFIGNPMRATMLAVVIPGAGQIYNRKYWKIPFVYAGFGALIYSARRNGEFYMQYMVAYQDLICILRFVVRLNYFMISKTKLLKPKTFLKRLES